MARQERVFMAQDVAASRRMDLSDAERYGRIVSLLPEDKELIYNSRLAQRMVEERLKDFSDRDYIMAIGDPIAIMLAGVVAARNNNGKVNVLRWDKSENRYLLVQLDTR